MMIQKNLELQLQALNMIEQKYGLTPASFMYETTAITNEDPLVMEEIIQKHALEDVTEDDPEISSQTSLIKEHERLAAKYNSERALLEEALKVSQEENTPERETHSPSIEEEIKEIDEKKDETDSDSPVESKPEVSEEDMKKRQAYLKARRDKLVALKKEARSQRLEMNSNSSRPSSARAVAEATIKGEQELKLPGTLEPSIIHARKALAARLQAEVIRKQTD